MNRMRIVLAALVTGILVSVVGSATAADRPPALKATPKAALGTRVVITGFFFHQLEQATLYLESGKTRKALASAKVPRGGRFTLTVKLPKSAPKGAHLLACQAKCSWRVRLALVH